MESLLFHHPSVYTSYSINIDINIDSNISIDPLAFLMATWQKDERLASIYKNIYAKT